MEHQRDRLDGSVPPANQDAVPTVATSQPVTPAASTAAASTKQAPRPLWRNRDFMLLWVGQSVSALGTSMAGIVYPLLALLATSSVVVAGTVGFAGMATATLLRLPSGVLVDRWPRKVIIVVADVVRAVVTAAVVAAVLADVVTIPVLVASAVVSAACGVMSHSAQTVVVRHVVPGSQLPQALAQNEARGHAASLAGQPLGGYLYGFGAAVPLVAESLSFLASGVLTAMIRTPLDDRTATRNHPSIWRDLPTGLRYAWRDPFLRVTLLSAAGFQLIFSGLTLVVIASATERGIAAVDIGFAFAIGGVGGILGAIATGRAMAWLRPVAIVAGFGVVASTALAVLAGVRHPYAIGALLGAVFFASAPANALLVAAQIQITPPHLQGRVLSAVVLLAGFAAPLGPFVGGLMLDQWGHVVTFLVLAALAGLLTIQMFLSSDIRKMRRPDPT